MGAEGSLGPVTGYVRICLLSSAKFFEGDRVALVGLEKRPSLNGRLGRLRRFDRGRERWEWCPEGTEGVLLAKEKNLAKVVDLAERNLAKVVEAWKEGQESGTETDERGEETVEADRRPALLSSAPK